MDVLLSLCGDVQPQPVLTTPSPSIIVACLGRCREPGCVPSCSHVRCSPRPSGAPPQPVMRAAAWRGELILELRSAKPYKQHYCEDLQMIKSLLPCGCAGLTGVGMRE